MIHTPDKFVLVSDVQSDEHHIFAGWGGGYLTGDSWRLSTPITALIEKLSTGFIVKTNQSEYRLNMHSVGMSGLMYQVWANAGQLSNKFVIVDDAHLVRTTLNSFGELNGKG